MTEIRGKILDVVTLDFETYFDKDFTLSKLSTSDYVRDPRFHAQMVGIKINDEPTQVYDAKKLWIALRTFKWKNCALLCHNTAFDGFILSERYKIKPAFYLDTLSMARGALGHNIRHDLDTVGKALGLGGKVGAESLASAKGIRDLPEELAAPMREYCRNDVDRCYQIYKALLNFVPDDELELIDHTIRMFCQPVLLLDEALAQEELDAEVAGKVRAVIRSGTSSASLMSNPKFADALLAAGVIPPTKVSKTTGKVAYAFAKSDQQFTDLLNHSNPRVVALVQARLTAKSTIGESRATRFLETGKNGQKIPVGLNYYGAHTGRWSGANKMNMQNLPRQAYLEDKSPDPATGRLRRSLLAPPGKVLVVADSSQIEARMLAWLAGQQDLLNAFASGQDVYVIMASKMFGVPVAAVTKFQRHIGKTAILALGYGMGPEKFFATLRQTISTVGYNEVVAWVALYRSVNHCIERYWATLRLHIPWMMQRSSRVPLGPIEFVPNAIALPNGMFLRYPDLRYDHAERNIVFSGRHGPVKLYGGIMAENITQALARIVIGEQMLTIARAGFRPIMTTHDEIVVLATEKQADRCLRLMLKTMSTAPEWAKGLPLSATGGYDTCYSK